MFFPCTRTTFVYRRQLFTRKRVIENAIGVRVFIKRTDNEPVREADRVVKIVGDRANYSGRAIFERKQNERKSNDVPTNNREKETSW